MKTNKLYLIAAALSMLTLANITCKKEEESRDQEKPTVSILYPANNSQFINDETITVRGDATDNIGVSSVSFLIDGIEVANIEKEPYTYEWNLEGLTGSHTIKLKANDEAENTGESSVITVIIEESEVIKVFGYVKNSLNNTIEGAQVTISINSSNKSLENGGNNGSETIPDAKYEVNNSNSIKSDELPIIHIQKIPKNSSRLEDWINSSYTNPPKHNTVGQKNNQPTKTNNLKNGQSILDDIITDANGYFEFLNIEPGNYTIQVSFNDYEIYSEGFTIESISLQKDVTLTAEKLPQLSNINLSDGNYEIEASWSAINKQTLLGYNDYDKHFLWFNGELSEDQNYFYPQYTSWAKTNSSIISTTSTSYSSEEYNGKYGGMALPVNIDNIETPSNSSTDIDYIDLPSKSQILASFSLLSGTNAIYIPSSTHEITLHMRFYYTDAVQVLQMSNWKVKVSTNGTTWTTAATHNLPSGNIPNYNYGYTKTFSMNNYKGQTIYLKTDPTEFPNPSNAFVIENVLVEYSQDGSGFDVIAADFIATPTSGTAPLTVNFTDQSTNTPTSWQWDFGDGNSSTQQSPSHTYQNFGDYTVGLTVTNNIGTDTEVKNNYINVTGNEPVAAFTANPTSGIAPLTVNFTDQSTNTPTSWQWDFGDGNSSTQQNPSHIYQNVVNYTVELTVTNNYGSDSEVKNNYINVTSGGGDPCPGYETVPYEGQVYNTVLIGDQCWFKENLNYETGNSWCYDNDPGNCDNYGRLYNWETALVVCPSGWKLPSDDEWKILEGTVDSQYGVGSFEWGNTLFRGLDAGLNLKSTSGWENPGNGTDLYGFGALPGGGAYSGGSFSNLGYYGIWWSSSEYSGAEAWYRRLYYGSAGSYRHTNSKTHGFSVRCLKD